MKFKREEMKAEFWELDPKLQLILCEINTWALGHGEEMVVTCLMRSQTEQAELVAKGQAKDPTSVHMYGRGADVRLFQNATLNLLLSTWVDMKYPYDPRRPMMKTLLTHEGTAEHHHLQVMPSI